jgi:hypothetical protein
MRARLRVPGPPVLIRSVASTGPKAVGVTKVGIGGEGGGRDSQPGEVMDSSVTTSGRGLSDGTQYDRIYYCILAIRLLVSGMKDETRLSDSSMSLTR